MIYDVLVIGGGVIGCMTARELSKYKLLVCLAEKQNDVAVGATKANSGIIHGGYDPIPNTLKAELNAKGVEKLFEAAEMLNVPYRKNGSLVCAFGKEEEQEIYTLFERGRQNGISGLRIISGDEARKIEPELSEEVTLALQVQKAGIISPYKLAIASMGNAMDNGVAFERNFEVSDISKNEEGVFVVTSNDGKVLKCRYLINCAGAYSGIISKMAGGEEYNIIPRAGEYMLLDKTEGKTVSHTIFQVPTKAGKGVLVTPTADGNLLLGPTAAQVEYSDNTNTTSKGLSDVSILVKKSVPTVDLSKVITSFTGVRASIKGGDFIIEESKLVGGLINAVAIDSPGLTCCVAIAEYIVNLLKKSGLYLESRADWNGFRTSEDTFYKLDDNQKNEFIKTHAAYGRIICRCEGITEGEIRACLSQNPPAWDMDGVKRRTRTGMGRCQGGFCSPYVIKLISEELGIPMEEVTKKGGKSYMLTGRL